MNALRHAVQCTYVAPPAEEKQAASMRAWYLQSLVLHSTIAGRFSPTSFTDLIKEIDAAVSCSNLSDLAIGWLWESDVHHWTRQ